MIMSRQGWRRLYYFLVFKNPPTTLLAAISSHPPAMARACVELLLFQKASLNKESMSSSVISPKMSIA